MASTGSSSRHRFTALSLLLVASLLIATPLIAEVKLPALLSDGMVVQRDIAPHFWGLASPGERVSVRFRGEEKTATADLLGHWNIYLSPSKAGGPFEATISGQNLIVLHDVYVGDVWVASGQSNMEFPLEKATGGEADIAAASYSQIHLIEVKRTYADSPQEDFPTTGWRACSPESVRQFSAVAYYFGKTIHTKEKVPIGLIASYWGGTVAEAWTSMEALAADPALTPLFAVYGKMMAERADSIRQEELQATAVADAKAKGLPEPKVPWRPDPRMWQPAMLFNSMISPLTPFPIRGVLWYQGESNSIIDRAPQLYERQFQTLIRDWRARWGEGDFPFLYVQISNFTSTPAEDWSTIREAQRKALALRNTGMVVTIDIGDPDDVHPLNKLDVGNRLSLIARATVYGESIEYSGPLFRQLTREPGALRVWFDHAGAGLQVHGAALTGFEVAGSDGHFQAAEAHIDGNSLIIRSNTVPEPVSVRYGWENNPSCNLFNREGLPASPFKASLPPLH
jgi:sialate O-acetylesterase